MVFLAVGEDRPGREGGMGRLGRKRSEYDYSSRSFDPVPRDEEHEEHKKGMHRPGRALSMDL